MRKWINLLEKAIVIDTEDVQGLVVHINPTRSDLAAFINNKAKVVRGIISSKSYFWSAFDAYHYDVAETLLISYGRNIDGISIIVSTNLDEIRQANDWEADFVYMQSDPFFILVPKEFIASPELVKRFPNAQVLDGVEEWNHEDA
jgi:hypothetical protein